jgi:hypothetical protein
MTPSDCALVPDPEGYISYDALKFGAPAPQRTLCPKECDVPRSLSHSSPYPPMMAASRRAASLIYQPWKIMSIARLDWAASVTQSEDWSLRITPIALQHYAAHPSCAYRRFGLSSTAVGFSANRLAERPRGSAPSMLVSLLAFTADT